MSIDSMSKHDVAMMEAEGQCPFSVEDVDLFAPGSQEYWFDAYRILHQDAPVLRIPGGGDTPDKDGFILTKYEDVARIVRDTETFPLNYGQRAAGQEVEREILQKEGHGDAIDAQVGAGAVAIVGLYQRAYGEPAAPGLHQPGRRADATLEVMADHARAAPDAPFGGGPTGG